LEGDETVGTDVDPIIGVTLKEKREARLREQDKKKEREKNERTNHRNGR
jgi:hypothetical protein